jgi:hypothetical protein
MVEDDLKMKFVTILYCFSMFGLAAADEKNLKIENLQLAQSEDGTPLQADFQFVSGEVVFFNCRVSGFTRMGDEPPKLSLTYQIEARDPNGVLILPVETGKVAADLTPEDKHWRPKIRYTIALPPLADTGQYRVIVKVKDEFGKVDASSDFPLLVRGRAVEPSDTMAIRNFRFLRSEEDAPALKDPAYRPGDSVWARFDMTGYKIGEKNHFDVEYGLKVLRPNGDVTYEEPQAAEAKDETFYPQRYTPGILSLNLPKDLATGDYKLILTVQDVVGGQKQELVRTFSVQ